MDNFLNFLADNFWLILLIIYLLIKKEFRLMGLCILVIQLIFGEVQNWLLLILIPANIIIEILKLTKAENNERRSEEDRKGGKHKQRRRESTKWFDEPVRDDAELSESERKTINKC